MNTQYPENIPLCRKTIKTSVEPEECPGKETLGNEKELISFLKEKFPDTDTVFVAYLFDKVQIGKFTKDTEDKFNTWDDSGVNPENLINMRVFNKDKELHLWRVDGSSFNWRLRLDSEGNSYDVVDVKQTLWGTKADHLTQANSKKDEWSLLTEDRGVQLTVPFKPEELGTDFGKGKNRLKVLTRHYIGRNENHQAGYVDARMVRFVLPKEVK